MTAPPCAKPLVSGWHFPRLLSFIRYFFGLQNSFGWLSLSIALTLNFLALKLLIQIFDYKSKHSHITKR